MNHPKSIKGYESLDELAKDIARLRYDSLSDFLYSLAKEVEQEAGRDKGRGRVNLAYRLYNAAEGLYDAQSWIEMAWHVCKRHMKE